LGLKFEPGPCQTRSRSTEVDNKDKPHLQSTSFCVASESGSDPKVTLPGVHRDTARPLSLLPPNTAR